MSTTKWVRFVRFRIHLIESVVIPKPALDAGADEDVCRPHELGGDKVGGGPFCADCHLVLSFIDGCAGAFWEALVVFL